ncbi:indole-3-glycerol phosphate synthase TrpC [Marivirga sp. S37H4]|uniref:indole-3-glycerol-phosphate synthase n=1 Tax=Marivirga aurantiaca TaxID=2802615 RepID=A0A934WZ12_9BACT|nr:indole-3-glycerol phosphate synthase TrpC [Marivirga aurantiaca]MBK6265411.1 indole-3-glycerol phosphate synthase TrpC [Marivirga aurantiaca]
MNTLEKIIAYKRDEVNEAKKLYPIELLKQKMFFNAKAVSLSDYIKRDDKTGVIAEIKRKSPSEGFINKHISVEEVSIGYMQASSSALSVLTDNISFGGSLKDLEIARKFNYCPILRKDFMVDAYQVYEAKAHGADAVLLIASALNKSEAEDLAGLAHELGMEVLLEIHNQEELDSHLGTYADLVGVNSRDLKTFSTSLETAGSLVAQIPDSYVKVAESGIKTPEDVLMLRTAGFQGFLIGTAFMKSARPDKACQKFSQQLRNLSIHNVAS